MTFSSVLLITSYVEIAFEHGPFIVDLPIKDGDCHSDVKLPEGRADL